jgi:hypothetical protein
LLTFLDENAEDDLNNAMSDGAAASAYQNAWYAAKAALPDALRAERLAVVEEIRERLLMEAPHDGCDGSHQFCDSEALPPAPVVWGILDEVGVAGLTEERAK